MVQKRKKVAEPDFFGKLSFKKLGNRTQKGLKIVFLEFLIIFCIQIEYYKVFNMMLSIFYKNAFLPRKRAKKSKKLIPQKKFKFWSPTTKISSAKINSAKINWLRVYFLNRSTVFNIFLHKDRIPIRRLRWCCHFSIKMHFCPGKGAKVGRAVGQNQLFLYIAQYWLVIFFSVFCLYSFFFAFYFVFCSKSSCGPLFFYACWTLHAYYFDSVVYCNKRV